MSLVVDILSWGFILAGGFFTVVGAFGLLRMPDIYTRLHASGVLDPFGVTLITVKLVFLVLLLLFTSPVACHALGRAALHHGIVPRLSKQGDPSSKP